MNKKFKIKKKKKTPKDILCKNVPFRLKSHQIMAETAF